VMIRVTGPRDDRLHLLRIGDEDAVELGAWDGAEIENGIWRYVLPPGTRTGPASLTFAMQHSRDVTFLAQATPPNAPRSEQVAKEHP
jgi:hypothetical protein